MTPNVNIIFSDSDESVIDASGYLKTCKASLGKDSSGNTIDCKKNYEFTPMACYYNPVTWQEIVIMIILKIIFIIIFEISEAWGWFIFYIVILVSIAVYIYLLAIYEYTYENILITSNFYENPWWIFWTLVTNILFYVVLYLCKIQIWGENRYLIVALSEIFIWVVFFAICIADAYRFLLHKHLLLDIANAFGIGLKEEQPESEKNKVPPNPVPPNPVPPNPVPPNPVPPNPAPPNKKCEVDDPQDEVFNIGGNKYTYKEAKAVCKAFGAKLANYEQIEDAYLKGAEWVSYGWSEGQYAYFPLQKETWEKLDDYYPENANGKIRPGISGGYFANPEIKFGANCFGKKPRKRSQDLRDILPGPKPIDNTIDEKAEYYKKNAQLYWFNTDRWYKDPSKKD